MARLFDHVARRHGSVTLSQFQLLAALRRVDPQPLEPREIASAGRGIRPGAAAARSAERSGLLERRPHATDGRRARCASPTRVARAADRVRVPVAAAGDRLRDRTLTSDEAASCPRRWPGCAPRAHTWVPT